MRHDGDRGGAPQGNSNARTHGIHSLASAMRGTRQLDGRTVESRYLAGLMQNLAVARGCSTWNDLPPQLQILARRISFKDLICSAVEEEMLKSDEVPESLHQRYLSWSNSLRSDLVTFGLERVPKDVPDLALAIQQAQRGGGADD